MNREDIIRMAQKAGIKNDCDGIWCDADGLIAFAELVVAAEREACAAMLDENAMACESPIHRSLLQANAQAIREMGQP